MEDFSILSLVKSKLDVSLIDDEIEVSDWTKLDIYSDVSNTILSNMDRT